MLWILVGAVFVGAVHDYAALMASVRHRGMSLAEIARQFLGPTSYRLMLGTIWLVLVYVLTVFLDLTAATFVFMRIPHPTIAGTALVMLVHKSLLAPTPDYLIAGLSLVMLAMTAYLLGDGLRQLFAKTQAPALPRTDDDR